MAPVRSQLQCCLHSLPHGGGLELPCKQPISMAKQLCSRCLQQWIRALVATPLPSLCFSADQFPHHSYLGIVRQVLILVAASASAATITATATAPITVTLADVDLVNELGRSGAIPPDAHLRITSFLMSGLGGDVHTAPTPLPGARARTRRQAIEATCTNLQDDLWHNVFVYSYTGEILRTLRCVRARVLCNSCIVLTLFSSHQSQYPSGPQPTLSPGSPFSSSSALSLSSRGTLALVRRSESSRLRRRQP